MSTRLRIGLSIVIALLWLWLIGSHPSLAVLAALGLAVLIPLALKFDSWLTGRQERARLAFDADYQHAAWRAGDDRTAYFGRWQPPPEMHRQ